MFHVEKMEVDDFPFAVQLANTMNWNMTLEDFEFMVKIEPQGCFVLFQDQEHLGIANSVSFGKTGWFGNLIVKETVRREGAGNLLTKHAIAYLRNKGVESIGLYAYPHLVTFYESFGFEADIDFLVLKGKAAFPPTQEMLRAANSQDVPEIIDFDCQCFGANRKKLLEPILLNKNNLCYIANENSEITGYVAAKVYDKMVEVGPLMCHANHAKEAVLLLETILSKLNGVEVFMYIPKKETDLLNVLHKAGLKEDFRVVRMFLGPAIAKNCICAAESLERG
ncbi:GNAT family N-acetyltransferase [Candidatus Bathyarchaeota archaeon]|nr:GNAT family N-acetyltransferase [Candidatus Bathyarchaeota archaeon]